MARVSKKAIHTEREHQDAAKQIKRKSNGARSNQKLAEIIRVFGHQPTFHNLSVTDPEYDMKIVKGLNWANQAFDNKDLKEFFIEYCKEEGIFNPEYENLPDFRFASLGKMCFLMSQGLSLSHGYRERFENNISALNTHITNMYNRIVIEKAQEEEIKEPKPTPEQIDVRCYNTIFSYFDFLMTNGSFLNPKDVHNFLKRVSPSKIVVERLISHYTENVNEAREAMDSLPYKGKGKNNHDAKTFYELMFHCGNIFLTEIKSFLSKMSEEVKNDIDVVKKVVVKKVVDAKTQVKNLKFMKASPELKVKSIIPENIVGATALLIFNTKSRKFGIMYSLPGGFSVSGTTIQNVDEAKSTQKLIRKPEETLATFLTGVIKRVETMFSSINSVATPMTPRISSECLIIKAYK